MGKTTFHSVEKHTSQKDWVMMLALVLLGCVGLFVLLTIQTAFFWQQLTFLLIGAVVVWGISRFDVAILWWFAPYGYILSLLFLISTYFGPHIRGATRWLQIGNLQLQPSEIVKPLVILYIARLISELSPRSARTWAVHILVCIIPFLLVFKQPDLGTSIVYLMSWVAMMVAGGFPVIILALVGGIGGALFPVLWGHLQVYQQNRILTFINPTIDPQGAGYNALQAMIAVGSGQLFGKGLGMGTQSHMRFLPEFHTDFIFATLIEELGFIGGVVIFILYITLLWRMIAPYLKGNHAKTFGFLYTIGFFTMVLTQIVINAGMNMGIIPVTGITLPFVSYGGSSILAISLGFGILLSVRREAVVEGSIAIV